MKKELITYIQISILEDLTNPSLSSPRVVEGGIRIPPCGCAAWICKQCKTVKDPPSNMKSLDCHDMQVRFAWRRIRDWGLLLHFAKSNVVSLLLFMEGSQLRSDEE